MKNSQVSLVFDYAMDEKRTSAYLDFIKNNVFGKTVVELGAGSGILAWLCVKYGANHVYAYENNKRIFTWLDEFFKDNNKVTIVKEDVSKATLLDADIYLQEHFASDVYGENILNIYKNLKYQNLEDKTFPNKIKIQHGTYDTNCNTITEPYTNFKEITNPDILEFLSLCPMDEILPGCISHMEVDKSRVNINKTLFDGDIKDLLDLTLEDTNDELVFWEATFNGHHTLSNWKDKTHWNTYNLNYNGE